MNKCAFRKEIITTVKQRHDSKTQLAPALNSAPQSHTETYWEPRVNHIIEKQAEMHRN